MGTFTIWDYVVLIGILIISAVIGIYYRYTGGKQKTTKEYLLADGSMSAFPVSFSLMASLMSAISLLGVSNESYQFGTMFCVINVSYIISTPIAAYLYLPVFHKMQTTSVYEYLECRFGHATRLSASLAYSLQMILYMGIVLYAPALALEAVTGINMKIAILAIGLVCTFYSTIGGMKAVLITDVFQSLLMFAAIFSVIVCSAIKANGLSNIWITAKERGRIDFTNFDLNATTRHTWLSLICGGSVTYLSLYGVNQTQIQRLLSVRSLKSAQKALWWNLPILCSLSLSTLFSGLAIFYYYQDCDPVLEGRIKSRDQLMPLFAVDTMGKYPGLSGLFVSGIFSASLSTVSSAVSSLSAVTLEDYVKPLYQRICKRQMTESSTTFPTKVLACIYGLVCVLIAFSASALGNVLQASLTIFGVVGGPLLAIFSLGMFTTKANQRGVLLALAMGLTFSFWIGFGGPKPLPATLPFSNEGCPISNSTVVVASALSNNPHPTEYFWLFRISYLWFSVIGFMITFIMGYCFSWILEKLNLADNSQIYVDESKNLINFDLFAPPLSRIIKREAANRIRKFSNIDGSTM